MAEEAPKEASAAATPVAPTDESVNIPLPNGNVFKASRDDLLYLATMGAAQEYEKTKPKAKEEPASDDDGDSGGDGDGEVGKKSSKEKAQLKTLEKQVQDLAAEVENTKNATRIEKRKNEIISTIDSTLSANPVIRDNSAIRRNVQESILATIMQNPNMSTEKAIDSVLTSFESFAKVYANKKNQTRDITRNTPTSGTSLGPDEKAKVYTMKDMKDGTIRKEITAKLREAAVGSFD